MSTTRARLLDCSQVQGHIDFVKVRAGGYSGVYLKATEGAHYVDPSFDDNCARARIAGLLVGAYHFLTAQAPVADQIALFVGTALNKSDLPPAVDFEYPPPEKWIPPITGPNLLARALEACRLTTVGFGHVCLYTYPYFMQGIVRTCDAESLAKLALIPLWIASYHDEKHEPTDADQPTIPKPWTTWYAWQWSGDHGLAAPGVNCVVDHDVFNGTPEELEALVIPNYEIGVNEDTDPGSPPGTV